MDTPHPADELQRVFHQARKLEALMQYPEWATYVEMLQDRIDNEATMAMSPSVGLNDILPKEFAKGTFAGIRFAMLLPSVTIAAARDIRDQMKLPEEDDGGAHDIDQGPVAPPHPKGNAP